MRRQASIPPTPGMLMSSRTMSNSCCFTTAIASSPLRASSTAYPPAESDVRSVFRREGSSSTINTLTGGNDTVGLAFQYGNHQPESHFPFIHAVGFQFQCAAVRHRNLARDVQSQSRTRCGAHGLAPAIEAVENAVLLLRRNGAAPVGNPDFDEFRCLLHSQEDRRAGRRVSAGILEQLTHREAQQLRIHLDLNRRP